MWATDLNPVLAESLPSASYSGPERVEEAEADDAGPGNSRISLTPLLGSSARREDSWELREWRNGRIYSAYTSGRAAWRCIGGAGDGQEAAGRRGAQALTCNSSRTRWRKTLIFPSVLAIHTHI